MILNQYKEGMGISQGDIENTLGYQIFFTLERDEGVLHSVNVGKPMVLNGSSKYAKNVKALVSEIRGSDTEVAAGLTGRLKSVFRRRRAEAGPSSSN